MGLMATAVHFGAGNIGRGFVAPFLRQSGYEVVFADVSEELIGALQTQPSYRVHEVGEGGRDLVIEGYRAIDSRAHPELVSAEIARADVVTTAVGARTRSRFWKEFTTTSFELRSRSGHAFAGVDGEALDLTTPMRFEIHRGGLTLLVPKGNVEAAEQRRAREVSLRGLLAVAAGHEPAPHH